MNQFIPDLAISARQPWAYAIVYLGKDIENRGIKAVSYGLGRPGLRAIHAAKGMTREEYEDGRDFIESLGLKCPPAIDLKRGGIIGAVEVTQVVKESASPWFFGPRGLVLRNPEPLEFIPSVGALGLFKWKPADPSIIAPPAKWMMPKSVQVAPAPATNEANDLFAFGQQMPGVTE